MSFDTYYVYQEHIRKKLRTYRGSNRRNIKNTEPLPKFTGSYKKECNKNELLNIGVDNWREIY